MTDELAPAGTIARPIADAVIAGAVAHGAARDALDRVLGEPGERVPIATYLALWEAAMRLTRDPGLPMTVAREATLERFGLAGYALYTTPTLGDALRRLARFHDLLTDSGRWGVERDGANVVLVWDRAGPRTLGMRVANEQILAAALVIFERLLGSLPVTEVRIRHAAPADLRAHERLFRAPLRFEQPQDAVVLPAHALDQPSPGFDPHLQRYFLAEAAAAVDRIAASDRTAALVSREILALLPDGIPRAATVGARLGLSERTLRRRLAAEGRSFDKLVAALQRDRADVLLRACTSVGEVAVAVGFADVSSFSRAYKRWTGRLPSRRDP